jgi:hypothetical protein
MFEEGLLRQFPEQQNAFFHIIEMFLWFGQNFGIYFFPHHQYYNGYRW